MITRLAQQGTALRPLGEEPLYVSDFVRASWHQQSLLAKRIIATARKRNPPPPRRWDVGVQGEGVLARVQALDAEYAIKIVIEMVRIDEARQARVFAKPRSQSGHARPPCSICVIFATRTSPFESHRYS
jgi:hypothetical protein